MSGLVRRLTVSNFRNYRAATLEAGSRPIVLYGPNGAGKTNLIEAISFLAPGRGLRRATLEEVACNEGDGSWAVSTEVEGALGLATLGTGIERIAEDGAPAQRKYRIDRESVGTAAAFSDHVRIIWMVPAMDSLFTGAPAERRRFLDRLATAIDSEHSSRVNAFERALRSRNRLLEEPRPDAHWLDAVEHETAELAVAVASLRAETVGRLRAALSARAQSAFPPADIALDGWMESLLPSEPAVFVDAIARSSGRTAAAMRLPAVRSMVRT
jgi:DNA replication and repair protein RecF